MGVKTNVLVNFLVVLSDYLNVATQVLVLRYEKFKIVDVVCQ